MAKEVRVSLVAQIARPSSGLSWLAPLPFSMVCMTVYQRIGYSYTVLIQEWKDKAPRLC